MFKYCSHCGKELKEADAFCPNCGAKVEDFKEEVNKSASTPEEEVKFESIIDQMKEEQPQAEFVTAEPKQLECPVCGAVVDYELENCPICGAKLSKENVKKSDGNVYKETSNKANKIANVFSIIAFVSSMVAFVIVDGYAAVGIGAVGLAFGIVGLVNNKEKVKRVQVFSVLAVIFGAISVFFGILWALFLEELFTQFLENYEDYFDGLLDEADDYTEAIKLLIKTLLK